MTSDLPKRDVVATGIGVISPLGTGQGTREDSAFWQCLLRGATGVRHLTAWDARQQPVQMGAELADFEPKQLIRPRKSLKVMSREIQTAVAAAVLGIEDARFGLTRSSPDPERTGIVLGADMLYADLDELSELFHHCVEGGDFHISRFGQQFPYHVHPLWLLKYLPNMSACHVSIAQDAQGPCNTIVSGDASGVLAIVESAHVIQRGAADVMITGGSGSRLMMTPWVFRGDCQLSHRNQDPANASRPFDAGSDGMVNGEGAAVIVLEERQHAVDRGAQILGTFLASAVKFAPTSEPSVRASAVTNAIRTCLSQAALPPTRIQHVNAHGVSIPAMDRAEAAGIAAILPDVPVIAPKANFGNLGAGSGAVELSASLFAQHYGVLPSHPTFRRADPECPVHMVTTPRTIEPGPWLKLSLSFTGQVVCVCFGPGIPS